MKNNFPPFNKRGKKYAGTYSLSNSATVHLYCAVEKRHISANWRTRQKEERKINTLYP
jgi:hypothetical protein